MVAYVEISLGLDINDAPDIMNWRKLKAFAGYNYTDNNRVIVPAPLLAIF